MSTNEQGLTAEQVAEAFMREHGLTVQSRFVAYRPASPENKWAHFEWVVTLTHESGYPRVYGFPFRLGIGHCKRMRPGSGERTVAMDAAIGRALKPHGRLSVDDAEGYVVPMAPTASSALISLQGDCRSGEHMLFEDFASEFGYDTDSREAESIWRACQQALGRVQRVLGSSFEAFMGTEFDF